METPGDGAGIVHMRHDFEGYEEDGDGVSMYCRDYEQPVRAKILVGCDGYFSAVRMECLDDGPSTFSVRQYSICTCSEHNIKSCTLRSTVLAAISS